MKIVIFGSTGSVGSHVVEQALRQGHQVTAFTRNPNHVATRHERLTVAQGDVLDSEAVLRAVAGQDAVVVTLGAGRKGEVRSHGTAAIIDAMQRTGVRRLICQSTLGVGESRDSLNFYWKRIMFGLLLRPAYADHVEQERRVRDSDLDWTIVRPSAFTNGPQTGKYERGFGYDRMTELKISRADVADFIVDQLTDESFLRAAPAISY
ncbi:NAD(P)-dependent oxidoreductase [Rhodococcus sp. NPDC058521]|uniref:NAD(P)-dependent oxidoreductase n=1 Tax=Rhodococcus sp. NPDC058521 TaxID=3346536 RepID=UPI0036631A3C